MRTRVAARLRRVGADPAAPARARHCRAGDPRAQQARRRPVAGLASSSGRCASDRRDCLRLAGLGVARRAQLRLLLGHHQERGRAAPQGAHDRPEPARHQGEIARRADRAAPEGARRRDPLAQAQQRLHRRRRRAPQRGPACRDATTSAASTAWAMASASVCVSASCACLAASACDGEWRVRPGRGPRAARCARAARRSPSAARRARRGAAADPRRPRPRSRGRG